MATRCISAHINIPQAIIIWARSPFASHHGFDMENPEEEGIGVVKCALGRLRPEPAMREALTGAVHAIQEVAVRGSLIANGVARRALLAGTPWDSDSFPKVGEQSWWRNVFSSCCRTSRTKDGSITRSRDALFGTDVTVRTDMYLRGNILSSLARDALTNARLHVQDNFMRQLRKAFHREVTLHETVHGALAKGVRGKLVERALRRSIHHCHPLDEPEGAPEALTATLQGLANTWRQCFPSVSVPVLDSIKEAPLRALMQWTFLLQRHTVSCVSRLAALLDGNSDEAKALFGKSARMVRPLPLHDAKVKHVCVDLSTLAEDLLPRSGRYVPEVARGKAKRSLCGLPDDPKSIRLWREKLWKASFPGIDRLLGRQKRDAFFLRTDGISASVAFRRGGAGSSTERLPKRRRQNRPAPEGAEAPVLPRPEAFDRLVGIDPGRRDMIYAVCYEGDVEKDPVKMSTREMNNRSGAAAAAARAAELLSAKRLGDGRSLLDQIKVLPSNRDFREWDEYVRLVVPLLDPWMAAYRKRSYLSKRLLSFARRDAALDALCARIVPPGRSTLVAFGSGADACCTTGFGHGPAPQRRLRRRLALTRKDVYVLLVAEPYTSQRCHSCKEQLETVWTRLKRRKRKPKRLREPAPDEVPLSGNRRRDVVGVRKCQTCRGLCGEPKHWHRDANAARNILEAGLASLRGESRPAYLTIQWGRREGNRSTRLASTTALHNAEV